MGKQRQCRGDLFVFKDVFSAQFLNCQRIVKSNTDHRKIHLEISISLSSTILFRFHLRFPLWILCGGWIKSKVNVMYFVATYACLYFYTWIETISVLDVNNGIWKTDTKSVAAPGRRRRQRKKTTPMRERESHSMRERKKERASETQTQTRATRATMSKNNNNFKALPKSNMAELNVCALLFVRSFAICGHCCHDNRLHALVRRGVRRGKGQGCKRACQTWDRSVACS